MTAELRATFEQCRRRYPTVDVGLDEYAARVEQVRASAPGVEIHHEELFLAFACSRGDRIAWEYFADEYLHLIRRWAGQACGRLADGEDLSQEIVKTLLDQKEKFAGYNGRGSLASWLRVAVSRAAIDRFRRRRPEVSLEEMQERDGPTAEPGREPVLEHQLDAKWGTVIAERVSMELDRLPARDRLLLGLYYVEQAPLKAIAAHFGVHESTASRWLDGVRNALRRRVEREVRARFGLRPREVQSLWKDAAEQGHSRLGDALRRSSQIAGVGDK